MQEGNFKTYFLTKYSRNTDNGIRTTEYEIRNTEYGIRNTKYGLTLIELMISVVMFAVLVAVTAYVFRAVLLTWSSQERRAGIDIVLDRGIEEMVRDLREAKEIQSTAGYDEIRFSQDQSSYYIYYLYNASDSYAPPPAFNQAAYELRKALLTGDINGTFTYGSGQIIITDVLPPLTSDLCLSGNIVTIDLSIIRGDESIRSRTEVVPRNI